jgi:hypothetical protein
VGCLQGGPNRVVGHHRRLLVGAAGGGGHQPLLHAQQLGGGPAALLQRPIRHHRHGPLSTEPISKVLELGPADADQLATKGSDDVLAGEGGRGRGQSVRTCQPLEHLGHRPLGQALVAVAGPAGHLPDHGVRIVAALGRLRPPASIQGVRGLVIFGLASDMDGPLDQPGGPLPPRSLQPLHLQVDLAGALGEQPDQVLRQALELPVAVGVRRCPFDPECPDKLALVSGPVDGVRGPPVAVEVAAVQGCPAAVRALDPVGDDQVGVQQRIAFPGCPVVEADRQHPASGHVLDTAVTPAGAQVLVQVGDRLGQPGVMGGQHRPAGRRITEAVGIETLLVGRRTTSKAGTALRP